jgi:hypothetical protein
MKPFVCPALQMSKQLADSDISHKRYAKLRMSQQLSYKHAIVWRYIRHINVNAFLMLYEFCPAFLSVTAVQRKKNCSVADILRWNTTLMITNTNCASNTAQNVVRNWPSRLLQNYWYQCCHPFHKQAQYAVLPIDIDLLNSSVLQMQTTSRSINYFSVLSPAWSNSAGL